MNRKSVFITPDEVVRTFAEVFNGVAGVQRIEIVQEPNLKTIYFADEGIKIQSTDNRYLVRIFLSAYVLPTKEDITSALDKMAEEFQKGRKGKPVVAFTVDILQKNEPSKLITV